MNLSSWIAKNKAAHGGACRLLITVPLFCLAYAFLNRNKKTFSNASMMASALYLYYAGCSRRYHGMASKSISVLMNVYIPVASAEKMNELPGSA